MKSTLVFQFLSATLIALLLAACGGGGGSAAVSTPAPGKVWGVALAIDIAADAANGPQIAVGANGTAIAVWEQDDGTGTDTDDIWVNRYTAGAWGTAERIDSGAGDTDDPQIAIDAAGNAIAVWEQLNIITAEQNIRTARYTVGIGWEQPETIDSASGVAADPQIAIDATGNAIVVWEQDDGTGTGINDIWANRYTAGAWGTAELIESGAGDTGNPQIAIDAAGNAIAVWEQSNNITAEENIRTARYTVGIGWEQPETIDSASGDAYDPQIAVDATGNVIVVWEQDDGTGNDIEDIWANRYTAGAWGTAERIESGAGDADDLQIAIDAAGNAIVVWEQDDGTGADIDDIWANRYTAGAWGTAERIESGAGDAADPQIAIAIAAAGDAIVVWNQDDGAGADIDDIWVNRYAAGAWGTAERIETGAGDAYDSQIAVDVNGNAIVVWEQDNPSTGVDDVMANTYR